IAVLSCPGLTRASMFFARQSYEEGWIAGSSPAMTFLDSGVAQSSHARLEISILALLRCLLPGVAVPLGLRLEAQVSPLLAVAGAVAENLLLAGEILRRTMDARGAVPGRRLHAEIRVDEVRARQRHEIGAAGGDDRVDLVGGRDRADAHGRERGLVADLIGKWRLEHAAEDRLRVRDGLSGGHVDEIAPGLRKRARDLHGIVAGEPAVPPVRRRNANRHRLLVGPDGAHGAKDLEREAQAVFEATAIFVAAGIGERRDETREQITLRFVHLHHVEAGAKAPLGRGAQNRAPLDHSARGQLAG